MKHVIFLAAIFMAFGCKKDPAMEALATKGPSLHILFEYEYINFAWGHIHHGWFIDSSGNVLTYKVPVRSPGYWNMPDSTGTFTESELASNLSKTQVSNIRIDRQTIKENVYLTDNALKGEISQPISGGNDMGAMVYYAYTYNMEKKEYTRVLLGQKGDFIRINHSNEAKELVRWLNSISQKVQYQ